MRQFLPDIHGIETSTLVLIFLLALLKWILRIWLPFGFPNLLGVLLLAFGDIIHLSLQTFFYAILLQALLSWIQPGTSINQALYQFTSPIMQPMRRIIPPINGIDISPIPVLILLQLITIVLIQPFMALGWGMAQG
jgi:YggT family protein